MCRHNGVTHDFDFKASVAGYSYECSCGWSSPCPRQTRREAHRDRDRHLHEAEAGYLWFFVSGETGEISAPFISKRQALLRQGNVSTRRVTAGVYSTPKGFVTTNPSLVLEIAEV